MQEHSNFVHGGLGRANLVLALAPQLWQGVLYAPFNRITSDDAMGEVRLRLRDILHNESVPEVWYPLMPVQEKRDVCGELCLR